jgi:peptidoglycan hydrolase-like protein with peptidoglycan-binding domain
MSGLNKYLISGLILIAMFSVSMASKSVSAFTVADLQSQIQSLLQQVQQLQDQLKALQQESVTPEPATSESAPLSVNLTQSLRRGSTDATTGGQVSELQRFLARDKTIYPEGLVTGYYGPLTEAAVQRWQARNNIVSSGDANTTGYGVVGPKTRAKISSFVQTGGFGPVPILSCIIGDANGDGDITAKDASLVTDIYFGRIAQPDNICCVDSDANGEITPQDALYITNYYMETEGERGMVGEICTSVRGVCACPDSDYTCTAEGNCVLLCPHDGDVNEDGEITARDSYLATESYLGRAVLTPCQKKHGDVNNDGEITPADALCIINKYMARPSCLD